MFCVYMYLVYIWGPFHEDPIVTLFWYRKLVISLLNLSYASLSDELR